MAIHVAITRKVRPGCEEEFQRLLLEFFQASFAEGGVLGAILLVPVPGSGSREYGILRTFRTREERDAFYDSPGFKAWDERARTLTEGDPAYRPLEGLEAWFRGPGKPPPRWKMALLTWLAVWPVSIAVPALLARLVNPSQHKLLFPALAAGGIVVILTWLAMPVVVKIAHRWLQPTRKKHGGSSN